jgi:hypothetical protein
MRGYLLVSEECNLHTKINFDILEVKLREDKLQELESDL